MLRTPMWKLPAISWGQLSASRFGIEPSQPKRNGPSPTTALNVQPKHPSTMKSRGISALGAQTVVED
jgi:hypothetical protein